MDAFEDTAFQTIDAAIQGRQHVGPKHLMEPGPDRATLERLFQCAAAAPDHEQLRPWRFIVLGPRGREALGQAFAAALCERDPLASAAQQEEARSKAFRGPCLLLAVADLSHPHPAVPDAEKLLSLGCAVQNLLLGAHAMGYATGLTSGKALGSAAMRTAFGLRAQEQAICFISLGRLARARPRKPRPQPSEFVTWM